MSLNDDDIPTDLGAPNASPLGGQKGHNYEEGQRGGRGGGERDGGTGGGGGRWGHNYEEGTWLYSIFQRIEMMCLFGLLLLASSPALVQVGVLYC